MRYPTTKSLLPVLVILVIAVTIGCGGGGDGVGSPTPSQTAANVATPVPGLQPVDVVRTTLDDLTRGDVDAAYAYLSTDARKDISLERIRLLTTGLKAAGLTLSLTLEKIGDVAINGNLAEIDLTVRVKFGETDVPVNDSASLVKESGEWRISDHFIQTALAAVGLAKPVAQGPRELGPDGCAIGDPMLGVYAPSRLKVLDPCITVTGMVRDDIEHAQDGDITFGLILSDADKRLVNQVNEANYGGALHIEIVPLDQGRLSEPKPGDRIRVTGPWVTDLVHGHNEIHPAFVIEPAP